MAGTMRRPLGYSKVNKEDPDEKIHQRAQFLIYKVLEKADDQSKRRPSNMRIRIRKFKVKIGKRFMSRLRKTMLLSLSAARVCVGKQASCQLKTCKRLFSGGQRSTVNLTLPSLFY